MKIKSLYKPIIRSSVTKTKRKFFQWLTQSQEPEKLSKKQAVTNINNTLDKLSKYSVPVMSGLGVLITPWLVSLTANSKSNSFWSIIGSFSATAESGSAQKNYNILKDNKDSYLTKLFYFGIPAVLGTIAITVLSVSRLGMLVGSMLGWAAEWGIAEVWNRIFKPVPKVKPESQEIKDNNTQLPSQVQELVTSSPVQK